MQIVLVIPEYIVWHYSRALRLTLNIITNFIWFTYHFFSIPILVKTFLSPWHVAPPVTRPGFHPILVTEDLFLPALMRICGPIIRAVVIVFGLTLCVFLSIFGLALFLIWLSLPLVAIALFIEAIYLLIS